MNPIDIERRFARRTLLGLGASALGLACSSGPEPKTPDEVPSGADGYVLRGGHVMTMDPEQGDLLGADVYIREGVIIAIGKQLSAPGAHEIDASKMIVLPGFIDMHSHLWSSQARGVFGSEKGRVHDELMPRLARAYEPEDMRVGTLLGASTCLMGGVTTVCVYCDNVLSAEHAEAAIEALNAAQIRGRFMYGPHGDMPAMQPLDLAHVKKLAQQWKRFSPRGLLSLGIGWRAPVGEDDYTSVERARREVGIARADGLPLAVHVEGSDAPEQLRFLIENELLGKDLQVVHATGATPEQLQRLSAAGVSVTLAPVGEQRAGLGVTQLAEIEAHLDRVSFGCDGGGRTGSWDMFSVMRTAHDAQAALSRGEVLASPRRLLEMATLEGARALGVSRHLGSLVPGKQADILLVDTQRSGTAWSRQDDPSSLLVFSARAEDVASVFVQGVLVKHEGRLLTVDESELVEQAEKSIWGLRERAVAASG